MNFWLVALTPENYEVTRRLGFTVQGFARRNRRKVERMEPGDRLVFYVLERRVFPATATLTSRRFEEHTPLWVSPWPDEDFPYRVHIKPDIVLPEGKELDARQFAFRLEYVRRWVPEEWPLAFLQGDLHLVARADFELIENEMRRVLGMRLHASTLPEKNARRRKAG